MQAGVSVVGLILLLETILFVDILQSVYSVTCWWVFVVFPVWAIDKWGSYERLWKNLCMDKDVHFSLVKTGLGQMLGVCLV